MVDCGARFCSDGCRDYYDAGAPGHAQDWRQAKPDYSELRQTQRGFRIACAHCCTEFESKGLRCCSPKCDELRKPVSRRKQPRRKIAYYSVKASHKHHNAGGRFPCILCKTPLGIPARERLPVPPQTAQEVVLWP
jgi:hypothetical protein